MIKTKFIIQEQRYKKNTILNYFYGMGGYVCHDKNSKELGHKAYTDKKTAQNSQLVFYPDIDSVNFKSKHQIIEIKVEEDENDY